MLLTAIEHMSCLHALREEAQYLSFSFSNICMISTRKSAFFWTQIEEIRRLAQFGSLPGEYGSVRSGKAIFSLVETPVRGTAWQP